MRILMIEDDEALSGAIQTHLTNEGYAVDACTDGETGLFYGLQNAYDIILLDRMLPKLDGIALLAALRKNGLSVPVLMITALNAIGDRVEGLDAGADDYLVKPFAVEELLARVRALTRRPGRLTPQADIRQGDICLIPIERKLTGPSGCCILSKTESALLEVFLKNPGQVLPRELIYLRVWGPDTEVEEQSVDNYVHFVRRRLKSSGSCCKIETVRSVGYRFEGSHEK